MKEENFKMVVKTTLHVKTNSGDLCKLYLRIVKTNEDNVSLITMRYVLSNKENFKLFENTGFVCVKRFKDKILVFQVFGIRLGTFAKIANWVNELGLMFFVKKN